MDLHRSHGEGSPAFGQRRRRSRRPDLARPGVRRPGDLTVGELWSRLVALWPRIAITLICLAFWRILAAIPLPVAGLVDLRLSSGRLVADGGLPALLLGNPLEQESVVALGLNSFLDAFIIFWLWAASTGNLEKVHRDRRWMGRTLAWLTAGHALARRPRASPLFVWGARATPPFAPGRRWMLCLPPRHP